MYYDDIEDFNNNPKRQKRYDDSNESFQKESNNIKRLGEIDTDYEDNWEKGGGEDMEEVYRGTF
jgi:hypothetical protein